MRIPTSLLVAASLAFANVNDPAKHQTPYHAEYALFRSANMASPDKLSTGSGFHSFRIPAVVRTTTGRILAFVVGRRHDNWDFSEINAAGAGNGIKMSTGELVVPAMERNIVGKGSPGKRTWSMQLLDGAGAEGTVCETPDGKLYRNDRPSPAGYCIVARGTLADGFMEFTADEGLPDPACQDSVLRYNADKPARTTFLNSASKDSRRAMRVRISYDADAAKYKYGRKLADAPVSGAGDEGGYSSMTKTADYKIGVLVESVFFNDGTDGGSYRCILWRRFNLSWILNGPNH